MTEYLYPVPAADDQMETLIADFLDSEVKEKGLSPDTQFLFVLFGEDVSEAIETAQDVVDNHSAVAREARAIDQLGVVSIDERRLNTFTTSLLFNLLEVDRESSLQETLTSDVVLDEDERKIDYYLPRLHDQITDLQTSQQEAFETTLSDLFPVALENDAARDMNDRLEKDIVTDQTILDYLLLAAASTDDQPSVRELVTHIREEGIDESGYLSGGSDNVAGYQRVFSLAYHLNEDDFREEFKTARSLYKDGATGELFRLLNDTDGSTGDREAATLEEIYTHESPVERLLTNQFAGNDREIAQRLLRVINGTRIIENGEGDVKVAYEQSRTELEETINELETEISLLSAHNDVFNTEKISVDAGEAEPLEVLVKKADRSSSTILSYLLGHDRGSGRTARTSVFSTLETRIGIRCDELADARRQLDSCISDLESLEQECEIAKHQLDEGYSQLADTDFELNLPPQSKLEQQLDQAWETRLTTLRQSLPKVDLTPSGTAVDSTLDEWESKIDETRGELGSLTDTLDEFENYIEAIKTMHTQQEAIRTTLAEIDDAMGGTQ